MASPTVRFFVVTEASDGQRLDNFLFKALKGVPKSHVYRVIRSGEVRINKGRCHADSRVHVGDEVRVPPIRVAEPTAAPSVPARQFACLYEDEAFMAINKPAGVAVHGGSGVSFGVIEQLRQAHPTAPMLELVHRLDRETSGILLVAKKKSALTHLQAQFKDRHTHKTYLALVKGVWPAALKVLDKPLYKYLLPDGERRVRITHKDDPHAMTALSLVRVLASGFVFDAPNAQVLGPLSLLAVTIKTGRTHQIRVHLSASGHPIVGDEKYGDFEWNKRLQALGQKRMFLHAWKLGLQHPKTQTELQLLAPLPPDLEWGLPQDVIRVLE